uniref:Uncharacterized protein n=1 Tax=Glossina austeni TaxID=7395 RepID=A0A1A9VTX4_GLOAU
MPPKANGVMKTCYKTPKASFCQTQKWSIGQSNRKPSAPQNNSRPFKTIANAIQKSMPAKKATAKITATVKDTVTERKTIKSSASTTSAAKTTTQTRKTTAKVELTYKK